MPDRLTINEITSDQLDALYEKLEHAEQPGPREHCGDQKPESFGGPPTECVLRPGHSGSHADDTGARWWLARLPSAPVQCWHTERDSPCDWDVCRQPERLVADERAQLRADRDRLEEELVAARSTVDRVRDVAADMHGITGARTWARALDAALAGRPVDDQAQAAVDRVRALHRKEWGCCSECTHESSVLWPCPTILALDGTEQPTTERQ